jgi:cysteinyl-tRNA synthetase
MNTTTRPRRPSGSRNQRMTGSLAGCIESAASVVEELKGEIEEWRDNMESNNMEHMPKFEEVSECYDALEQLLDGELDSVEVPEFLQDLPVTYTQDTRRSSTSRASRLGNAESELDAAAARVREWLEDNETLEANDNSDDTEIVTEADVQERDDQREQAEELADKLEELVGQFGDVNFPGMY